MNYLERLKSDAKRFHSIVCMGMDPVLEDIPIREKASKAIVAFYEEILNSIINQKVFPAAVKPNYAFYAQYGMDGLEALCHLIALYQREGFLVILDVKRGDIGKTAEAYAKECFEFFSADAVTLSPYMGFDSIAPFILNYPAKGAYVLVKTSNVSSSEIQDVAVNGMPLYLHVCKKIIEWDCPGLGAVVGATFHEQLEQVLHSIAMSGKEIPLLIPGIGTQGGDVKKVVQSLCAQSDFRIHRINSSSAINYAYKRFSGMHYAKAAVHALKELNEEINALVGEY
ncbi:MAG: orotidine-5'-phosphate decarboxylase [Spirochaetes bacterium]|nr:orotidine-5'-phosphate decarboxylase [Spirochaetota bacterium]